MPYDSFSGNKALDSSKTLFRVVANALKNSPNKKVIPNDRRQETPEGRRAKEVACLTFACTGEVCHYVS